MSHLFTIPCLLLAISCTPPHVTHKDKDFGKVEGLVQEIKGNQMPSPGKPISPPIGISDTVYVYELTNINQVERIGDSPFYSAIHNRMVTTTVSNSTGHFSLELPAGEYSLFTKRKGNYYSNLYDNNNNIAPIKVIRHKTTSVVIRISDKAVF